MSTVGPSPASGARRGHRPRRGRGRGGQTQEGGAATTPQPPNASLALRPASVAPPSSPQTSTASAPTPNRGRNRRGGSGRGGGRGGLTQMVNGQRAFGGQLTAPSETGSVAGSLAGDAPEFVPGQPVAGRRKQTPRARRMSKSQAQDIATRIHEDITNGQYECVICTNEVLPNSKIWTCKTCWVSSWITSWE
jgi:transcriptional repressor NF-X1